MDSRDLTDLNAVKKAVVDALIQLVCTLSCIASLDDNSVAKCNLLSLKKTTKLSAATFACMCMHSKNPNHLISLMSLGN